MSVYQDAVGTGVISGDGMGGVRPPPVSANTAAWARYAAMIGGGAVVGIALAGRDGAVPGALAGVAAVAVFGEVTWSGRSGAVPLGMGLWP